MQVNYKFLILFFLVLFFGSSCSDYGNSPKESVTPTNSIAVPAKEELMENTCQFASERRDEALTAYEAASAKQYEAEAAYRAATAKWLELRPAYKAASVESDEAWAAYRDAMRTQKRVGFFLAAYETAKAKWDEASAVYRAAMAKLDEAKATHMAAMAKLDEAEATYEAAVQNEQNCEATQ